MEQIKRDKFIELLYTKCAWDDVLSYAYDLHAIAENSNEYKGIVEELSEKFEDYRVKDALEKDFLKIVSRIKEEDNKYCFDTIKTYDNAGDSVFEDWREKEIQEIFGELKMDSRNRLRHQEENGDVYVRTKN